jgi:hypothetical protein
VVKVRHEQRLNAMIKRRHKRPANSPADAGMRNCQPPRRRPEAGRGRSRPYCERWATLARSTKLSRLSRWLLQLDETKRGPCSADIFQYLDA